LVIEGCTIASEAGNGVVHQWIVDRHLAPDFVSHEQLKQMLPAASLIVRTGEATPFANIALRCGVAF
jgi:D-ribose pyranase